MQQLEREIEMETAIMQNLEVSGGHRCVDKGVGLGHVGWLSSGTGQGP